MRVAVDPGGLRSPRAIRSRWRQRLTRLSRTWPVTAGVKRWFLAGCRGPDPYHHRRSRPRDVAEHRARAFDRFFPADQARTHTGGAGLGTLARAIAGRKPGRPDVAERDGRSGAPPPTSTSPRMQTDGRTRGSSGRFLPRASPGRSTSPVMPSIQSTRHRAGQWNLVAGQVALVNGRREPEQSSVSPLPGLGPARRGGRHRRPPRIFERQGELAANRPRPRIRRRPRRRVSEYARLIAGAGSVRTDRHPGEQRRHGADRGEGSVRTSPSSTDDWARGIALNLGRPTSRAPFFRA